MVGFKEVFLLGLPFLLSKVRADEGDEEENVGLAFVLVAAAGLSTTFGAALVFWDRFVYMDNTKFLGAALGFAGGVMLYVSFFEILQESIAEFEECECLWGYDDEVVDDVPPDVPVSRHGGGEEEDGAAILMGSLMFGLGVLIMYALDWVVHFIFHKDGSGDIGHHVEIRQRPASRIQNSEEREKVKSMLEALPNMIDRNDRGVKSSAEVEEERNELLGTGEVSTANPLAAEDGEGGAAVVENADATESEDEARERRELKRMGILTAVAISLHNFPEGLATLAGTLNDTKVGVALAVAIGIHNIPEGICVAMPIYYATGSRWKAFWYAFWSGVSEILGAALGYAFLVSVLGPAAFGVLLGIVAGLMITIVIKELLPTAHKYDPEDKYVTTSVMVGMAVMALSIVLFEL